MLTWPEAFLAAVGIVAFVVVIAVVCADTININIGRK
jgi:hypothetical protein